MNFPPEKVFIAFIVWTLTCWRRIKLLLCNLTIVVNNKFSNDFSAPEEAFKLRFSFENSGWSFQVFHVNAELFSCVFAASRALDFLSNHLMAFLLSCSYQFLSHLIWLENTEEIVRWKLRKITFEKIKLFSFVSEFLLIWTNWKSFEFLQFFCFPRKCNWRKLKSFLVQSFQGLQEVKSCVLTYMRFVMADSFQSIRSFENSLLSAVL